MRSLIPVPFSLALLLLLALGASLLHVHVHFHEAAAAAVACAAASILALLPGILLRPTGQAAIRVGLLATMIHMFGCLAVAGLFYAIGIVGDRLPFTCWLLGCYWISLTVLATVVVRGLRQATQGISTANTHSEGLA